MRVLVLGSGGREHALAWRLSRDPEVSDVITAPGNPGCALVGRTVPADLSSPAGLLALAERERVDLTVVGPEAPLDLGVSDVFRAAGRPIVGPSRTGAALECSKAFAKAFMDRHGVPTARFRACANVEEAIEAVSGREFGFPVVVKADGLAAGKGVVIAASRDEAERAVRAAMIDRQFGEAGARVVIEECLSGPEVSFFVLADGETAIPFGSAQDHKRLEDDDRGPNTGGMGAFAPSPLLTPELERDVMTRIVQPVLQGMRDEGDPYRGFLYVSLMLTADGPRVIEFNVRFGDPEAEVVLPLVRGSVAEMLLASATGRLAGRRVEFSADRAVGVVLASRGYPAAPESGVPIQGVERAAALPGVLVFHAGTRAADGQLVTAGGRVLAVVGLAPAFEEATARAYAAVETIRFEGMQFRRDIGRKAASPITQ
jgi:phosphoribosylamine--glycine ligase